MFSIEETRKMTTFSQTLGKLKKSAKEASQATIIQTEKDVYETDDSSLFNKTLDDSLNDEKQDPPNVSCDNELKLEVRNLSIFKNVFLQIHF